MKASQKVVKQETAIAAPVVEPEWAKRLKERAKDTRSALQTGTPRITHRNQQLYIDSAKVKDNVIRVVVLGMVWVKAFYEGEWEEGSKDTPVCYAFGQKETGLVPHLASPKKQADQCTGCEHNKFGTALRGKGKRCGDRPTLLVLLADDVSDALKKEPDDVAKAINKAQAYMLSIPSGSIKKLGAYNNSLGEVTSTGDLCEAITVVGTAPQEERSGYFITFAFEAQVPGEAMAAIINRSEKVFETVAQPFPVLGEGEKEDDKPVKGQEPRKKGRR